MPELPEVETIRASLQECLQGRRIEAVQVLLPRLIKNRDAAEFAAALEGEIIQGVSRRGKYLALLLSGPQALLVHLRMTGRLVYEEDCAAEPSRFSRVIFTLDKGRLVYGDIRTLGCLWLIPARGPSGISGYDSLGPDANGPDFTPSYLYERLQKSGQTVKAFLLDQTHVAGLGNIYVDEALFAARIRPMRCSSDISRQAARRLHEAIQKVLASGLEHGGTTVRNFIGASGREGHNQENLCVYGREGTPCTICGREIIYTKVAGRGTRYCPQCQK